MGNLIGNVDDQSIEAMHIIGNGWIYGFFIIGACLLAASLLVSWQVKRAQKIMDHLKAEDEAAANAGQSGSGTGQAPRA